jgi:FlaA1/EpsC-like NDP-sugar epimerase
VTGAKRSLPVQTIPGEDSLRKRLGSVVKALQGHRRVLALAIYAVISAAAYGMAFLLRFEFAVPPAYLRIFALTVLPLVLVRLTVYRAYRLSRERWRYASAGDVVRLVAACIVGTAVFALLFDVVIPLKPPIPVSVLGIEAVLTSSLTAGAWLCYRLVFEHIRDTGAGARVLIIGAGDAGNMLAREMLRTNTGYVPVGFVDDDPKMWGSTLQGREVIGATCDLVAIAEDVGAEQLIIAVPSASPADLQRVVAACEATGLPFKALPGIAEVVRGEVSVRQLRDVRIEDLLGREPVVLELPELAEDLAGRSILITGAAGSIGSELSRQVALHKPGRLVLFDQAETDLFYLELELRRRHPELEIVPVIGDIVEPAGVERVFRIYQPDRVFHAAAYKHVPMMELNPREALRNNVVGTWRVADAAGRHRAGKFVLVSTDKAVRPSNVMGASKRLAELLILELQERFPETAYGAVRFGNVLGSNGSVIPVFKRQIERGEPLTVTHPETTRYFMTIPEAVQLILQASLLDEFRGHIVMLEMGEPVRIADLAANLLRLSGVVDPMRGIVFTGLRAGEKLHEELNTPEERSQPTPVPKIRILTTRSLPELRVARQVECWNAGRNDDDTLLYGLLKHLSLARPEEGTAAVAGSIRIPTPAYE